MKHYLNPQLTIHSIQRHPAVSIGQNCLQASETIPPHSTLLTVKQSSTLCFSAVPQEFKWMLSFLEGVIIKSESHQLNKKLTLEAELLVFYLIYLRTNFPEHEVYGPWLNRPVNGLYYFARTVIEETENLDLLISYVAVQNHLNTLSEQLFLLLSKPCHMPLLQLLMNSSQCSMVDFRSLYVWSYHFINSRSFGYTQEYTMIPLFDMVNHSSSNDNAQLIVTAKPLHSQQEIRAIVEQYEQPSNECINSDNDSEEGAQNAVKVQAKFMDLHYHLVTTETIHKGQQIFLKYGNRNNMFLLEGYGFIEEFNKFDSLTLYFSTLSDEIYYDSVRGAIAIKCKLKRKSFDFAIILNLKKYYFDKYYNKSHAKAKVLWSVPKDMDFQRYYLSQMLRRLMKHPPKVHYLSQLNGCHEIRLWERQRKTIFQSNLNYIAYLYKQSIGINESLLDQQLIQFINTIKSDECLPQPIRQYAQLLQKLTQ